MYEIFQRITCGLFLSLIVLLFNSQSSSASTADDFNLNTANYSVTATSLSNPNDGSITVRDRINEEIFLTFNKSSGTIKDKHRFSKQKIFLPGTPEYIHALNLMLGSLNKFYKYYGLESVTFSLFQAATVHDPVNNFYYKNDSFSLGVSTTQDESNGFILLEDLTSSPPLSISLNKKEDSIYRYGVNRRDEYFQDRDPAAYLQQVSSMITSMESHLWEIYPDKARFQMMIEHLKTVKIDVQADVNAILALNMNVAAAADFIFSQWSREDGSFRLFSRTLGALSRKNITFAAEVFNELFNSPAGAEYRIKKWEHKFVLESYVLTRGGITSEEISNLLSAKNDQGAYVISTNTASEFFFNWMRADGGVDPMRSAIVPFITCNRAQELLPHINAKWANIRMTTQWRVASLFNDDNSWRQFFEPIETIELVPRNNATLVFKKDFDTLIHNSNISKAKKEPLIRLWQKSYHGDPLLDQFFIALITLIQKDSDLRPGAIAVLNECRKQNIITTDADIDLTVKRNEQEWKNILTFNSNLGPYTIAAALSQIKDEAFLFRYVFRNDPVRKHVVKRDISNIAFSAVMSTGLTQEWYGRITNRDEKKYYIRRIMVADTANFRPYITTGTAGRINYICIDFSYQLWMNGYSGTYTSPILPDSDFLKIISRPNYFYGIPIHTVQVESSFIDHAINAIFVGNNIHDVRNWDDWLFIEPATDEIPRIRPSNMWGPVYGILPYEGTIYIGPGDNPGVVFSIFENIVTFLIDNNGTPRAR